MYDLYGDHELITSSHCTLSVYVCSSSTRYFILNMRLLLSDRPHITHASYHTMHTMCMFFSMYIIYYILLTFCVHIASFTIMFMLTCHASSVFNCSQRDIIIIETWNLVKAQLYLHSLILFSLAHSMIISNIPSPSGSTQTTATSHDSFSSFSNQLSSRYTIPPNHLPYIPFRRCFWLVQQLVLYHHLILKLIFHHILTYYNKEITRLMYMHLPTLLPFLLIQFTSISSIVYYPPTLTHPTYTRTLPLAMNNILSLHLLVVLLIIIIIDWLILFIDWLWFCECGWIGCELIAIHSSSDGIDTHNLWDMETGKLLWQHYLW